jgi:lipid-binding SYLF domain-containing protein
MAPNAFGAKNQASRDGAPDPPGAARVDTAIGHGRGELVLAMKTICALLALCLLPLAEAVAATEQEVVNQSASILRQFRRMPERGIPRSVMRNAKGLAILTVVKVGFGLSGKGGQGVVVARTGNGWSGPSFVGTGGAGWGPQIGAQISEYVFVLNTNRAVRAFSRDGNVTVGGEVSAAAGPVGRDLQAGITPTAAIYTYSRSKGLFAGASLEGAVIATQKTANTRYYGRAVSSREILSGDVAPPPRASVLRAALGR